MPLVVLVVLYFVQNIPDCCDIFEICLVSSTIGYGYYVYMSVLLTLTLTVTNQTYHNISVKHCSTGNIYDI